MASKARNRKRPRISEVKVDDVKGVSKYSRTLKDRLENFNSHEDLQLAI